MPRITTILATAALVMPGLAGQSQDQDRAKARELRHGTHMLDAWAYVAEAKSADRAPGREAWLKKAEDSLAAARALKPEDFRAPKLLAEVRQLQQRFDEALGKLRRAERLFGESPPAEPDPAAARVCFDQAWIYQNCLHDRRDLKAVANPENLERALHAVTRGVAMFGAELTRAGKPDSPAAQALVRRLTQEHADLYELLFHTQLDLLTRVPGHDDEALRCFAKAIEQQPRNYRFLTAYAGLLERVDRKRAAAFYQRAISIDPEREDAVLRLAKLYLHAGDTELEAAAAETNPARVRARTSAGKHLLRQAFPHLEAAFQIKPYNEETLRTLVRVTGILANDPAHERYQSELEALVGGGGGGGGG